MAGNGERNERNGRPSGAPNGTSNGLAAATNGGPANRLSSWKEIAAYLDCDERTCLRWERSFGLPVHRLEGAKKSRVYAFRDEIDRWQLERSSLVNARAERAGDDRRSGGPWGNGRESARDGRRQALRRPRNVAVLSVATLIILAAVIFTAMSLLVPREPAGFRIEGSSLIVLNAKGRELWRHDTGSHNLAHERYRSARPQERWYWEDRDLVLPHLIIDDLDGDGRVETLFNAWLNEGNSLGDLACFSHRGKELWRFRPGRPLEFGATRFSGDFTVRGFDAVDIDGDGRKEILVIAHQLNRFPTRFSVLDTEGQVIGDYWNSGQLADFLVVDLDGDGKNELLTFGTNNEYGDGVIIAFDPALMSGCSPQSDDRYRWKDMDPGTELHYIRLPRADAELAIEYFPLESVILGRVSSSGTLSFWPGRSGLEFVFDRPLAPIEVRSSHGFQVIHEKARQAGKIVSVVDAAYFEDLRRRVLGWDRASGSWRPLASWDALAAASR